MSLSVKKRSPHTPPKDQTTLAKPSRGERYGAAFYLCLAFLVPFALMFFAFMVAKVSPFGNNQILVTDLWHQYYPFLVDYQDKLQHGGSLLWTWKSGGGTNYLALMAYYLASPLNFFSVLVPAERLREFLYIITCVKIGCAGLFYALFLRITFKKRDASITAFGIMYALCAFIMGYYWNIIWLDSIALLPLVIAGTVALLKERKFKLYIASLALSVLANYYIGLFICIFVVLVCIGYTIVEFKGWRETLRDFLKMLGCSVTAVMISAILTLPAYFALGHTHSADNTFPASFAINIGSSANLGGVLEAIGKTISNSIAFVQPTAKEGLPNIYCGMFTIFLGILFLFCSKIKKRERFCCGFLLVFFMLSFIIRQLDFVWHGFHFPNMLPYRFSFLYSFVLIYMAFRVFMNIDRVKLVGVIAAICGFLIYLGIATTYYNGTDAKLSPMFAGAESGTVDPVLYSGFLGLVMAAWVLVYALRDRIPRMAAAIASAGIGVGAMIFLVLTADNFLTPILSQNQETNTTVLKIVIIGVIAIATVAVFLVLASEQMNQNHQMLKTMLGVILLVLALAEGLFSASTGVKTVSVTDGSYYPLGTTNTLALAEKVKEREADNTDLPRTEVNKYYTLNDNALIGVDGISMFNSMVNSRITDYMEKFGLCGWIASNRYTYQESSPFTNMMLNLKYLISPYGATLDHTHNELSDTAGAVTLQQNKYYIPMGFVVEDSLLDYNNTAASASDPIANQNNFFRLATGLSGDLYQLLDTSSMDAGEGGSMEETSRGKYTYIGTGDSGTYKVSYTAGRDGVAVAYYDTYYSDNVSLQVNGSEVISYYVKRPFIMMIGDVKAGDVITTSASVTGSSSGYITSYVALVDENLFSQAYNQFSTSVLSASKVTDDEIAGNITVARDGLFYTSIPYVEGWTATVDGKQVEITPVGDAMLAFKISAGSHIVKLKYTPEGFVPGLALTILGLLIFAAMIVLSIKKINLIDRYTDRYGKVERVEGVLGDGSSSRDEDDYYDPDSDDYYDTLSDDNEEDEISFDEEENREIED
jgi:uncharacterized membrane protein YfhO